MKTLVGISLIITGVLFALFVGVWLCLIGGVVQIINEIKSPEAVEALKIGIGVARIACAGLVGSLTFLCFYLPGLYLIEK
jgi:uncharacterized membrane protein